jgi:mono/diheme cytochrome c family protein
MADGKGRAGAGAYPSLAGNKKSRSQRISGHVVVNGQRGMPPFGAMMSDDQVAAVVNYLRTHFGNAYKDAVTAEDVKSGSPPINSSCLVTVRSAAAPCVSNHEATGRT